MKCELYNDSFQNWKSYPIQKAQLIIADIPYLLEQAKHEQMRIAGVSV